MSDKVVDRKAQALGHLERAESYKKIGLNAQVQYEMSEAERLDPDIVHTPRYQKLQGGVTAETQQVQALRNPLRIGAVMLFVHTALSVFLLLLVLGAGGAGDLEAGNFVGPVVSAIIGVNLWRGKDQWQRYTVWWAVIGLVLFGGSALVEGDLVGLIAQLAFSGSLILLLAGTSSRGRMIASIVVYVVGYIGFVFGFLAVAFIAGFASAM
jgi:hypothetical protein